MPAISVVIPCYNAQRRLKRLLCSLQAQTFVDFEVVCVNDGSTDNTLSILQGQSEKFAEMRIISLPTNSGSYMARLTGIREAKGDYIYMPDADDLMQPLALQKLYSCATETGADIVCMGAYARLGILPKNMKFYLCPAVEKYNRRQMISSIFSDSDVNVQLWNKLYRRSLFDDITDLSEPLFFGDDTLLHLHACNNAETMAFEPYLGYTYFLDGGSCKWQSHKWKDNIILFKLMQQRLQSASLNEACKSELATKYTEVFCLSYITGVAQKLFLHPYAIEKIRSQIAEDLNQPIWTDINLLLSNSANRTAISVANGDIEEIIRMARQRNRKNFKNELISYLSTWKNLW